MNQLVALLATLLLETLLLLPLFAYTGWASDRRLRDRVFLVCAASLLTHPFAWLFIVTWRDWQPEYWLRALPVEVAVSVVEGAYYAWMLRLPLRRGLVLGFAANAFSFGVGVVLDHFDLL